MKILLSANLAFSALLATCMLQMGDEQTSVLICILSFIIILAGLILVDVQERFALSDGWANIIILLIVGAHLGVLLRSPTEFLAYSIANILAYVQMVLFFKKKEPRVCFQLTTISFLQVCVGCVSEQGILFATLLLVYCFSIICVLTLLFLVNEREYYEKHAFIRPAFGTEAPQEKHGVGHLTRLALKTFFLTPVYILFGAQTDEYEVFLRQDSKRSLPKFQFRSLMTGLKILLTNPRLFLTNMQKKFADQKAKKVAQRKRLPATLGARGDRLFGFWEQASGADDVAAPHRGIAETTGVNQQSRFPLLYTRPVFSGANRSGERIYLSNGLVGQLFLHSCLALVFAAIIFFIFPRFQKLEFGDLRFGHDGWRSARKQTTAAVGFSEHIQLGDLGPAANNHEVVLTLAFKDVLNQEPIHVKSGTPVYLRGVTLVEYSNRRWSRVSSKKPEETEKVPKPGSKQGPPVAKRTVFKSNNAPFPSPAYHMGHTFLEKQSAFTDGVFDPGNDLFCEQIQIVPFTSPVVFTVWPFFRVGTRSGGGFFDDTWFIRSINESFRYATFELYVNSFRDSRQVDLIPNQENVTWIVDDMLQVDEELLSRLCALARQWDEESELDKSDIIGRAKYLERQLRDENGFAYYRYNVERNRDMDPIEDFVSLQRKGHCEYFAGTLALMLRAVGIPSRIVIGFKTNYDCSELGDRGTVRQSDAHSWVEAYIAPESLHSGQKTNVMFPTDMEAQQAWWANGGWLRLDATPSYDAALFSDVSKSYHVWMAMAQNFWNTYILNYNDGRQKNLIYKPAVDTFKAAWKEVGKHRYGLDLVPGFVYKTRNFLGNLLRGRWNSVDFVGGVIPLLFVVLAAVWIGRKWLRFWVPRQKRERTQLDVIQVQAGFYLRLEECFARLDLTRTRSETPLEFITRCMKDERLDSFLLREFSVAATGRDVSPEVAETLWRDRVGLIRSRIADNAQSIVDAYYQVQFGSRPLEPGETERLAEAVASIEAPWKAEMLRI